MQYGQLVAHTALLLLSLLLPMMVLVVRLQVMADRLPHVIHARGNDELHMLHRLHLAAILHHSPLPTGRDRSHHLTLLALSLQLPAVQLSDCCTHYCAHLALVLLQSPHQPALVHCALQSVRIADSSEMR